MTWNLQRSSSVASARKLYDEQCRRRRGESDPLPGSPAWALGRIGTEAARQALRGREEADAWVREEIAGALDEC